MSSRSIDQKVIEWVQTLPPKDQVQQVAMYKAYCKHMEPALAFWYTKTPYEFHAHRWDFLYKGDTNGKN